MNLISTAPAGGVGVMFPVVYRLYRYTVKTYARFPVKTARNTGTPEEYLRIQVYIVGKLLYRLDQY